LLAGLAVAGRKVLTSHKGRDRGVRLRDLDGDGCCELIVGNDKEQAVFSWSSPSPPAPLRRSGGEGGKKAPSPPAPPPQRGEGRKGGWTKLPFKLPEGTALVTADGKDSGLRFVDIDEDGHDD